MIFLYELMFFFINSFLSFPLHIKRIILCFVYSDDHKPIVLYLSLKEEDSSSSCIVDVDPIPLSETHEKDDVHILIFPEPDHSCHSVDSKVDPLPSTIFVET